MKTYELVSKIVKLSSSWCDNMVKVQNSTRVNKNTGWVRRWQAVTLNAEHFTLLFKGIFTKERKHINVCWGGGR